MYVERCEEEEDEEVSRMIMTAMTMLAVSGETWGKQERS